MDNLLQDFRYGVRILRRNPALAIAAILCFALGIGVNSAIFSIVNGVLIRPLPYRDADRIVVINEGLPKMNPGMGRISPAEFVDYRQLDGRVFDATAIYEGSLKGVVEIAAAGGGSIGSQSAQGSGFVLDEDGHIVTNQHVVAGASSVSVSFWNCSIAGAISGSVTCIRATIGETRARPVCRSWS